jgi:hypothetical protein
VNVYVPTAGSVPVVPATAFDVPAVGRAGSACADPLPPHAARDIAIRPIAIVMIFIVLTV